LCHGGGLYQFAVVMEKRWRMICPVFMDSLAIGCVEMLIQEKQTP
jgi:hypothetical protein